MAWADQVQAQLEDKMSKAHAAGSALQQAQAFKAEYMSAANSDHEDGTTTPLTRQSPARSPESHTTNMGSANFNHGSELPVERGSGTFGSPTTSTSGGGDVHGQVVQASMLSEMTGLALASSTAAAAEVVTPEALICSRSTAASPVAMEVVKEEEGLKADTSEPAAAAQEEDVAFPTPSRQARSKRGRRTTMAPLVEVLLTLDMHPLCSAPPPVVVGGVRLAPHVASKARLHAVTTGLHNGCASLQRGDTATGSHGKRQRTAVAAPPAEACDRARDFMPGEPNPQTLSRACRFLLQQDDYCNAAHSQTRKSQSKQQRTSAVISDMRHQHRHAAPDTTPVPLQFIETVLRECTTWMAS